MLLGTIDQLMYEISQNTDPKVHPRITIEKIKGRSIIIIEVKESSDHLVLAFGRPFKRVGKSTIKMSKDEYERQILEKHKEKLYFDSQICKEAKLKDINKERLLWFVKEARLHRGLKVLKERRVTNTAILLFGVNP